MNIILDTDLGDDIDDSFALAYLLRYAKNDVKLILSNFGETAVRARIIAQQLAKCGCTDIPLGFGVPTAPSPLQMKGFLPYTDYRLEDYPTLVEDGIGKAIEIIEKDPDNTVIISLGPATDLAAMIDRAPQVMKKVKVLAMFGSVYSGYDDAPEVHREYNVYIDTPASQKMVAHLENLTIAPLDTCASLIIRGEDYRAMEEHPHPMAKSVMESYFHWRGETPADTTSILYDTQPIYMLLDNALLNYETLPLTVDEQGYIRIDREKGNPVQVAVSWKDKPAFLHQLANAFTE